MGSDAWGVDVSLEPSEPASAATEEAGAASPEPAESESTPREAAVLSAPPEPGASDAPLPTPPKPRDAARPRRAQSASAAAAAPGNGGPLADAHVPASSAPGIGNAARSSLLKDFVWVLSNVNSRDEAWHRLPVGPAGQIKLSLSLNEDGRIVESSVIGSAPAHMLRVWERTRATLERGRFAPRPESTVLDGRITVVLETRLSQESPEQTDTSDPLSPVAYAQTPASGERPGRAYFRFPSGRAVEILVRAVDRAR
jgi:hypothetical protein